MKNNNKEIIQTSDEVTTENKKFSFKDAFAKVKGIFKSDKIKNEALFKRGGYSIAITALVLAALIAVNWGFGELSKRFNLTIDMTENKKNSISEKNLEYIKALNADVEIIVCGQKDAEYMLNAVQNYGIAFQSEAEYDYFAQTIKLLDQYNSYNKRITIEYIDINSTEFAKVRQMFPEFTDEDGYFHAGDIIVSSKASGQERTKYLKLTEDIYELQEQVDYYYTMATYYTFSGGNKLESSLTSAIDYVVNANTKKAAIITSHSKNDYTEAYKELLTLNNYELTELDTDIIGEISSDFDLVIISAPTRDFIKSELDVLSKFLDNGDKLGKGLIYFADPTCPSLPNLNSFLTQWGIEVQEGMVFETNSSAHLPDDPTTMLLLPYFNTNNTQFNTREEYYASISPVFKDIDLLQALAGYIVPMKAASKASNGEITVTPIMQTSGTTVLAPIGSPKNWADYKESDMQTFDVVIEAKKSRFDNSIEDINKRELSSYVMAFSSVEFVQSIYATDSQYGDICSNQEIVMAITDRVAHKSSSHTFDSKVITYDNFYAEITEKQSKTVGIIFIAAVPIAVIAAGIVIFIRRRKSV